MNEPRVHRLLELWAWLPAFRFVAETEHLPTASDLLYTSPSALSRTVKQLESALGVKLFDRVGKRLVLNDDGRRLLGGVRRAMRYVDDVCRQLGDAEAVRGVLKVNSATQLGTAWLLAVVPTLRERYPELTLSFVPGGGEMIPSLLQGRVDLALVESPIRHAELSTARLGRGTSSVYCGRSHPLYERAELKTSEIVAHEFVAPPDLPGPPLDDWPAEVSRAVGLRVDQVRVALQACLDGHFLAVLPDDVARPASDRGELWRIPYEGISPSTVYALSRQALHDDDAAGLVVAALQEHLQD